MIFNKVILIIILLVIDVSWIMINYKAYNKTTYNIQKADIKLNMIGVLFSYILIAISILLIAIPLIESKLKDDKNILKNCIIYGGGLGLCIYGIYNFTNVALLTNYDYFTAFKDTTWGFFAYTLITYIYFRFLK